MKISVKNVRSSKIHLILSHADWHNFPFLNLYRWKPHILRSFHFPCWFPNYKKNFYAEKITERSFFFFLLIKSAWTKFVRAHKTFNIFCKWNFYEELYRRAVKKLSVCHRNKRWNKFLMDEMKLFASVCFFLSSRTKTKSFYMIHFPFNSTRQSCERSEWQKCWVKCEWKKWDKILNFTKYFDKFNFLVLKTCLTFCMTLLNFKDKNQFQIFKWWKAVKNQSVEHLTLIRLVENNPESSYKLTLKMISLQHYNASMLSALFFHFRTSFQQQNLDKTSKSALVSTRELQKDKFSICIKQFVSFYSTNVSKSWLSVFCLSFPSRAVTLRISQA